jgi:putative phosphoesterase
MRIGVISDTHGLLRPEAAARLEGVHHIIHAGDLGSPDILPRLRAIAPVSAVRGNVDGAVWAGALPPSLDLALAGHRLHVVHDIRDLAVKPADEGIALVICGHSHRPAISRIGPALLLNPGSAGPRRFRLPVTLATVDLAPGRLGRPRLHDLLAG